MLTFALILTLAAQPDAMPRALVLDSNLTGTDCETAMEQLASAALRGVLSCELDMATEFQVTHNGVRMTFYACPTEDSDNCLWDAQQHGNGRGRTFYTLDGVTHYLD